MIANVSLSLQNLVTMVTVSLVTKEQDAVASVLDGEVTDEKKLG